MSRPLRRVFWIAIVVSLTAMALAELPEPNAIVQGIMGFAASDGTEAEFEGVVRRGGEVLLRVPVEATTFADGPWYILRIPMETSGVTTLGPTGVAAHDGDVLTEIERITRPGGVVTRKTVADFADASPPGPVDLVHATITDRHFPLEPSHVSFHRGDSDGNGTLQLTDAVRVLNVLFLGIGVIKCEDAADADDNGRLQITDAVRILNFLFLGTGVIPAPGPATEQCGADPTNDELGCNQYDSCDSPQGAGGGGGGAPAAAGGGGGGEAMANALAQQPPLAAVPHGLRGILRRDPDLRAGRNVQGFGVWTSLLALSPQVIQVGDLSGAEIKKTLSIINSSEVSLDISLRSLSDLFAVHPSRVAIPSSGSYVVSVEPNPEAIEAIEKGDTPLKIAEAAGIEVAIGAHVAARVQVSCELSRWTARIEAGNVVVPAGTTEAVAVPVEGDRAGFGSIAFTLEYDASRFAKPLFLPVHGTLKSEGSRQPDGSLRVTMLLESRSSEERLLGHLVLPPLTPLAAGTYPVLISDARGLEGDGTEILAATTHGEVCCRKGWLDLDGDGTTAPGYEVVLARRILGGDASAVPESWDGHGLESGQLAQAIVWISPYLDVDASAHLDGADFRGISARLSGLALLDPDVAARVGNLEAPEAATFRPGILRFPPRLHGGALQGGERAVIPLLLDLADPLPLLDVLLRASPAVSGRIVFEAGPRLEHAVVQAEDLSGQLRLHIAGRPGTPAAVPAGVQPIGYVKIEASPEIEGGSLQIDLSTGTAGISGEGCRIPLAGAESPRLDLELCASTREALEVEVSLKGAAHDPVNYLAMEVTYPAPALSLQAVRALPTLRDRLEVFHEDFPDQGRVRIVVSNPLGESIASSSEEERLLELSFAQRPRPPEGDVRLSVVSASLGPLERGYAGTTLALDGSPPNPCPLRATDCPREEARHNLAVAREVLEFLFREGPDPDCPTGCDIDCDGALSIADVVLMLREWAP